MAGLLADLPEAHPFAEDEAGNNAIGQETRDNFRTSGSPSRTGERAPWTYSDTQRAPDIQVAASTRFLESKLNAPVPKCAAGWEQVGNSAAAWELLVG